MSDGDSTPVASVLMVDDHPANLLALEGILEPLGLRLVRAASGPEALRALLHETFALILLDVQMAGMSGLETAALIKQIERTRHIPIIFLTALSKDAEHVFSGYQHGAVDYLMKPIDPAALIAKVSVFVDLFVRAEQIRQSEERFRLLVDNVKDYAICMLDEAGQVVTWNSGAQRIHGYAPEHSVGLPLARFYPQESDGTNQAHQDLSVAEDQGRFEDEGWRVRSDGTRFFAHVVLTAVRNPSGHLLGFAMVTRDLTERRRAEEERVRLVQAQEALRLRDEFLAIASHELKTPLTALQLQLQTLGARLKAVDLGLAEKVTVATRSARRLSNLVELLLDVARISSGQLTLHPSRFDLAATVRDTAARFGDLASAAGCALTVSAPEPVVGSWDEVRIEQVLSNLLMNSIKFAAGCPVHISVARRGEEAILEVSDRGPGLPPEDLARLFDRFGRAASIRHYGGLGLGLYVTREIVEAHGGSISAQNLPGQGASLTVRIPVELKRTGAQGERGA